MRKPKRAVHMQFVEPIDVTPVETAPVIDTEATIQETGEVVTKVIRQSTLAVIAYVAADTLRQVLLKKLS